MKDMASTARSNDLPSSIVAFEGHPETISTQLRLLPTSPEILVLPGIQCYLSEDGPNDHFAADQFIQRVHDAVVARNETARSFLQASAHTGRQLVFLSGGTPSAQTLCIGEIMKHETDCDDEKAEAKFNFIVREGLAGLASQAKKWEENERFKLAALSTNSQGFDLRKDSGRASLESQRSLLEQIDEDPITRAMRAAEALDRQTGYLQPSTELDLTLSSRRRSLSLPMYGYSDSYGDAAPFYVFGGPSQQTANNNGSVEADVVVESTPVRASLISKFSPTRFDDRPDQYSIPPSPKAAHAPSHADDTYGPTFLHSPRRGLSTTKSDVSDFRFSADVEFGEASLVDMRMPSERSHVPKAKSLDDVYPPANAEDLDENLSTRPQSWNVHEHGEQGVSRHNAPNRSRAVIVKTKNTGSVSLAPAPEGQNTKPTHTTYVDRGTDAAFFQNAAEGPIPVLPATEDLVLYFKEEVSDLILDKTIRRLRDGMIPVLYQSTDSSETDTVNDRLPKTPNTSRASGGHVISRTRDSEENGRVPYAIALDDHGTFGPGSLSWPPRKPESVKTVRTIHENNVEVPPTPDKTPAPSELGKDHRIHEFSMYSDQTAVMVQNSLRAILNIYFPLDVEGCRQFQFSYLPELEGLWKPIFREAEPGSPRANNHRMDQVLAIGSQQGVDREYSSKIIGLLSKLGFKSNGMNRSGRLDFRYLLANAMQAFTAQPLTNQASDNPFNNPYLLATLIVPHLETYLALHSEVRYLLLEYPPQHLPTVLALQKLVGVDLMKVAQIVDAKNGDLGAFRHIRGASITRSVESSGHLGKPSGSDVGVSKANFLLTSSANESEIITFITTVQKILTGVSQYYLSDKPSTPAQEASNTKTKPPPLASRFSAFPKPVGLHSPSSLFGAGGSHASLSSSRPPSVVETVKTLKSARTARSGRSRRRPATADGGESVITYDPAEDSDYDFEERRLMPIFLPKSSKQPKPNSRKALKFLGLA